MVGSGLLMLALAAYALYLVNRQKFEGASRFLRWLPFAIVLPYLANTTGWLLTEVGRTPWIVFSLQRIEEAVSPNVTAETLLFSLVVFALIYGLLMAVDLFLLNHFAKKPDQVFLEAEDESLGDAEMAF